MTDGVLWTCPKCGRTFANRNQTHTCGPLGDLDSHFDGVEPIVRKLFDALRAEIEKLGPVEVLPEKTRIAFHVRMSFAVAMPRKKWLDGHLVLDAPADHPTFTRVETFSPRNHLHAFRLTSVDQMDDAFKSLLAKAYAVGEQKHLG